MATQSTEKPDANSLLQRLRDLSYVDQEGRHPKFDYSFVKQIIFSSPLQPLAVLLLHPEVASAPLPRVFRASYGMIFETIKDRETQIPVALDLFDEGITREALAALLWLKSFVYDRLIEEPEIARQGRNFIRRLVPSGGDRLGGLSSFNVSLQLELWSRPRQKGRRAKLLGKEIVLSEHYAEDFCRAVQTLLDQHCEIEPLLRLRVHGRWWTKRAPAGWPIVTRWLIPLLYDYLCPFYAVKRYPRRLLEDIVAILRIECPLLCKLLTPRQVQAAVQYYLKTADPKRPTGEAIFAIGRPYVAPPSSPTEREGRSA